MFEGALVDLADLLVAEVLLHRVLAGEAVAAVHLDDLGGHVLGGAGGKELAMAAPFTKEAPVSRKRAAL